MIIVYNKITGALLYTIEGDFKPNLFEYEGFIEIKDKITIGDYYFDTKNNKIQQKININLLLENNLLKIQAPSEIYETILSIHNVEKETQQKILLNNGYKEIPLNIQTKAKTQIFIFTTKHKSNVIILNDKDYLEGELIV